MRAKGPIATAIEKIILEAVAQRIPLRRRTRLLLSRFGGYWGGVIMRSLDFLHRLPPRKKKP
ncbi:hypothetical protein [Terrabacter terrigena]|uniref:Uncharacterized protein n=1 Tax=Terrabacter terrigena TaxID=574718 RepID=A0ABW3MZT2_9MICO